MTKHFATPVQERIDDAVQDERKLIARWLRSESNPQTLRLRGGELSAQEVRAVQAFIEYFSGAIVDGHHTRVVQS